MTKPKEELNVGLFRKCVAHFDNEDAGERDNAIRIVMKMCEGAGLHFYDACAMVYGDGSEEMIGQMQTQLETLTAENGELKRGVTALNEELKAKRAPKIGIKKLLENAWPVTKHQLKFFGLVWLVNVALYFVMNRYAQNAPQFIVDMLTGVAIWTELAKLTICIWIIKRCWSIGI